MIGQTISRYRIVEKLGEGGMGVVYRAEDTRLRRSVALKFLPTRREENPEDWQRFVREAQAAAQLQHPNIATVFDLDEERGFIALELVDGPSLSERVRQRPLKLAEAVRIAGEVGAGLQAAHEHGVVHRDVKSANILLTSTGQAKIADFGLATFAGQTRLTSAGMVVGTPSYMSPEQARGETADPRSDIWSLGIVLYEMITGQLPFRGETAAAVVFAILNSQPEPLTAMRSGVPVVLDRILLKALAKSPAERYQHVADMLVDLRSVQRELESSASEPLAPTPGPAGPTATDAERIRSLAVLPFSDMSPEKDQQYFCDGIAEELITSLAKIRDLQVAARTSAFAFKGSTADIREIGRTLNVQAVVEGSVRKAGAKLRIGVQLVGVADGYPLWTGRYDRDAADIFAVQDDVAAAIIDQLKLTLLPEERQGVFARRTDSLQAHSLYLEGLNYLWMYSSLGFYEAIRRFEHALRIDPNYAQAYWGLSAAHTQVAFWGVTPPREACQKVKHYAQRALALDPMLSDAHGALSYVHLFYDWDMAAAEREALEAIRLGPNSSVAHSYYAFYLLHAGRPWEAVKEALKAQSLDPVSSFLAFVVGLAFGNTGDFPRAIEELQSGLRLNGDFYILYNFLGLTYFANGEYEASVQAHQQAVNLSRRLPYFVSSLAAALHLSGRRSEADALWSELRRRAQSEYVRPCCFVQMHAGRGDLRQVSTWLKRAGEERDSYLPWMKLLPASYIQGHTESRWKARLRKALFNFVVQRTMDRNRSVSAH